MCDTYSLTISPPTDQLLDEYVDLLQEVKGLIKCYIVREFGEEGTHPHLHASLHFDSSIPLQTLMPRLKKVFGFIPTKPLVAVKPLKTLVALENWINYLFGEEGRKVEVEWGYLDGEIEALRLEGAKNAVLNNASISLSYRFLEQTLDWKKVEREDLFQKMFELKRKGYDCTNIATNPRKLALWFNFTKNAFNPKLNIYGDHTYKIFHPD